MAKRKDEGEALPGLDTLLRGPVEEPKPVKGPSIPDEELLGPLPQPGEAPRPQAVKVKAKAGTAPKVSKTPGKKKEGPIQRFFGRIKTYMLPQDPVELLRFKLRWIGLTRYVILPMIALTVAVLVLTYIWFFFWYYSAYVMVFSRQLPTVAVLAPIGVGLALAVFIPVNWLVLNRYERRWNMRMRELLKEKPQPKKPAVEKSPEPKDAKEPPLPQPTVNT